MTAEHLPIADLPEESRKLSAALAEAGIATDVFVLPDGVPTAAHAAEVLGVGVGAIANSLVFECGGAPLLVMTSGAHRVNTKALAERLGKSRITRASPEFVLESTGQRVGGVAPAGHPAPLETIVDETLAGFPVLWAGGGTVSTMVSMTFDELVRLTGGQVTSVE